LDQRPTNIKAEFEVSKKQEVYFFSRKNKNFFIVVVVVQFRPLLPKRLLIRSAIDRDFPGAPVNGSVDAEFKRCDSGLEFEFGFKFELFGDGFGRGRKPPLLPLLLLSSLLL
jgi:hypothetical protein